MPRTRYTKLIHKEQQSQLARQEKGLRALANELRREANVLSASVHVVPFVEGRKTHRRARLQQKQLRKPARKRVA